jgi:hypothetical protein
MSGLMVLWLTYVIGGWAFLGIILGVKKIASWYRTHYSEDQR